MNSQHALYKCTMYILYRLDLNKYIISNTNTTEFVNINQATFSIKDRYV